MTEMLVKCTVCGRVAHPSAEGSLHSGWPKCCGYTMRLESTKEFVAAVEAGAVKVMFAGANPHNDLGQDRA